MPTRRRIIFIVFLLIALGALGYFFLTPTRQMLSTNSSPDDKWVITLEEEEFGNSFGPTYFVIQIGPNNPILREIFGKELLTVESTASTKRPSVKWNNSISAVVALPEQKMPPEARYNDITIRYVPERDHPES
jgi:hypothetical protein